MLTLPSVASSSFLISGKLRHSLTASALTIPSRIRSWINRSGCVPSCCRESALVPGWTAARAALDLATIPPRYNESENQVESAETCGHAGVCPRRRRKQRERSANDERAAHRGHDPDGKNTGRRYRHAVEAQPQSGKDLNDPDPPQ